MEEQRQAEVERLRSEAESAGQAYLVARYGPELLAIRHGMELPRPFRLQYFSFAADGQHKVVRVSNRAPDTHAHTRIVRVSANVHAISKHTHTWHTVIAGTHARASCVRTGTQGIQQEDQRRA